LFELLLDPGIRRLRRGDGNLYDLLLAGTAEQTRDLDPRQSEPLTNLLLREAIVIIGSGDLV
jgi:hypothetical protein